MQYLRDKDVSGSTEARINSSSLEASTKKRGEPRHEYRTSATTLEAGSGKTFTTDLTRMRRSVCGESQKSNLPQNSSNARNDSLLNRQPSKLSSDYQPSYSVNDPHLEFYNVCRQRDKSKELHGPMRMKLISSYDRIKSDLELRSRIPAVKPHENWDVVPIIRRQTISIN